VTAVTPGRVETRAGTTSARPGRQRHARTGSAEPRGPDSWFL